jgi:hypothetical protein
MFRTSEDVQPELSEKSFANCINYEIFEPYASSFVILQNNIRVKIHLAATLVLLLCISSYAKPINPVIGDQSYYMAYGKMPDPFTNDQVRIRTHLAYAEFLLRKRNVAHLSEDLQAKRSHALDLLHEYWNRGKFPLNNDYKNERHPCFIDDNGTICAVGYLIEQTAGRDAAEYINDKHMYQEIMEMKDPMIFEWMLQNGLTEEECAIIQPSYASQNETSVWLGYALDYRLQNNFYHSVSVKFLRTTQGWYSSKASKLSEVELKYTFLNDGNFAAGIGFKKPYSFKYFRRGVSLGLATEVFRYNKNWGANITPSLTYTKETKWIHFNMQYGYAVPVINENRFGTVRHSFSAGIDINIDIISTIRIPKRPKDEDKPKDSGV